MNFCKDCKHSAPNKADWNTPEFQQKYRICTISTLDPVNGISSCADERKGGLFSNRCGPAGRYFQASENRDGH